MIDRGLPNVGPVSVVVIDVVAVGEAVLPDKFHPFLLVFFHNRKKLVCHSHGANLASVRITLCRSF